MNDQRERLAITLSGYTSDGWATKASDTIKTHYRTLADIAIEFFTEECVHQRAETRSEEAAA